MEETTTPKLDISIVIPVLNEEENVMELYNTTRAVLETLNKSYEIIFVDDGSTDKTAQILATVNDTHLTIIRLRRRFGQTAAMSAGIDRAVGSIIVFMDGDLQNDPQDIPKLLAKMDEGFDVVSGWRKYRKDRFITRTFPSKIANWLIGAITGVKLHDYGCSLKSYRAEVIKHIRLYGEMHRFIPALCSWYGATIAEMPVNHYPRRFGKSKYSLTRVTRVVLDLITVKFMLSFITKPLQIFGLFGLGSTFFGVCICLFLSIEKFVYKVNIGNRPLLNLGILLIMLGFQFITLGLLAEMMSRTYFESQKKTIYTIKEIIQKQ